MLFDNWRQVVKGRKSSQYIYVWSLPNVRLKWKDIYFLFKGNLFLLFLHMLRMHMQLILQSKNKNNERTVHHNLSKLIFSNCEYISVWSIFSTSV